MGPDEWSEDLHMFCIEIHIVQEELRRDEPVESFGGISEAPPGDDVGLRQGSLDALAQEVGNTFGYDFLLDDNTKAHLTRRYAQVLRDGLSLTCRSCDL